MPINKALWLTVFMIMCAVYPSVAITADWQETVKQGDELYGKKSQANGKEDINAAIKKYEEASKGIPAEDKESLAGLYVKVSRAYFTLAEYFAEGNDDESQLSDKGQDWAQKAIDADPKNAEGHYWMGANLGLWRGLHKASFRGGLMGGGIKKAFEEAAKLDPNGLYGLPYMRIGEYLLARGKPEEAQSYAEKAVKIGPKLLMNQIILAEIMWENKDKPGAKKILEDIVAQPDDILPSEVLENRHTIMVAKRTLEDIQNRSEPDW